MLGGKSQTLHGRIFCLMIPFYPRGHYPLACYMLESGVQSALNGIYFVLIANCHNHDNLVKPRAVEMRAILQYGNGQVLNIYFDVYIL